MSLGTLMDEMSWNLSGSQIPTAEEFAGELEMIADQCHWMGGSWKFGSGAPLEWNELQNTPKDIVRLTDHLLDLYRKTRPAEVGKR